MSDDATGNTTADAGSGAGAGAGAAGDATSATTTAPDDGTFIVPPLKTAAPEFDQFVPDAYKSEKWVEDLRRTEDPRAELFKKVDHLQKKMGERQNPTFTPPPADASEEVKNAFWQALGVADKPEAYELPTVEWGNDEQKKLGEALAGSRNEEFMNGLRKIAIEAKMTPAQFKAMVAGHDKLFVDINGKALAQDAQTAAQQREEFGQKFQEHFGTQDAAAARTRVWKYFEQHVPEANKAAFDRMDNEQLLAASIFADSMYKKFGREDKVATREVGTQTNGGTMEGLRADRFKLLEKREEMIKNNSRGPAMDQINQQIKEINDQMGTLTKK